MTCNPPLTGSPFCHKRVPRCHQQQCVVFRYLKKHLPVDQGGGGGVKPGNDLVWNFNKFLVDKHGRPSTFYYQNYDAPRLESDVYAYLSAP